LHAIRKDKAISKTGRRLNRGRLGLRGLMPTQLKTIML
jgi:hypothetical protein